MIGYYVHHQGHGHLHRAQALADALDEEVTGLSSLPRPADWSGPWVELPRDDRGDTTGDVTAGGALHWVPLGETGLRARSAAVSSWLEAKRPRLVVVDVSVEVLLLVRLHGVPVVSVVLPGRRTDPAHLLGFRVANALVAFSPLPARDLLPGVPDDITRRVASLGAVSRSAPAAVRRTLPRVHRHVVVLQGSGGGRILPDDTPAAETLAPEWRWTLAGGRGRWVSDIASLLQDADVVVSNAGESALADLATHRVPAIVVPAERPYDEQAVTASALANGGWPVLVRPEPPRTGWPELLDQASRLEGGRWRSWCDGGAAQRFARVLAGVDAHPRRSA